MKSLNFQQVKQQNFYTAYTKNGGVILKSYSTICGYIDADGVCYRVRYSTTTGKQITRFANAYGVNKQIYVDARLLGSLIFAHEGEKINTEYNGAY